MSQLLPAPQLPKHLPHASKWLAGEGAGSWFVIESNEAGDLNIQRFSPDGTFECEGLFTGPKSIDLTIDYELGYPSHCQKITLIQKEEVLRFERIEEE